mmetsp:Transcript_87988/g.222050  ORF Transcript_87988/g.222050 Transcript_87988/m.222050 type:complete len:736 (+) Transcript_87988:128-2335(+)
MLHADDTIDWGSSEPWEFMQDEQYAAKESGDPQWAQEVSLSLIAEFKSSWELTVGAQRLQYQDSQVPEAIGNEEGPYPLRPATAMAACQATGRLLVAHGQQIHIFEVIEGRSARVLFIVHTTERITHVTSGGVFGGRPVGAAIGILGSIVVFHTDSNQTVDSDDMGLPAVLDLRLTLEPRQRLHWFAFVDDDALHAMLDADKFSRNRDPRRHRIVRIMLRSDAAPDDPQGVPFFGVPCFIRIADCYVVGDRTLRSAARASTPQDWDTLPIDFAVEHILPFLEIRCLFGKLGPLSVSWSAVVEQECGARHREDSLQINRVGDTLDTLIELHPAGLPTISKHILPSAGGSNMLKAPALHGAAIVQHEFDVVALLHSRSRSSTSPASLPSTLYVCTVLRCLGTANVSLRILAKDFSNIPGCPEGLNEKALAGMVIRDKTAFFLSSEGLLYGLALHIDFASDGLETSSSSAKAPSETNSYVHQITHYPSSRAVIGSSSDEQLAAPFAECEHTEPAADIDPVEAACIEALQSVGRIERLLDCGVLPSRGHDDADIEFGEQLGIDEDVLLLSLNRCPGSLVSALGEGTSLRACRDRLHKAGHHWKLPSGTFVFVHPEQYDQVRRAIIGWELQRHHVIVTSSLEHLVDEAMMDIGKGGWAKDRQCLQLSQLSRNASSGGSPGQASEEVSHDDEAEDEGKEYRLVAQRTFLCYAASLQHASSVVQSTTEANSRGGLNPRRVTA